MKKINLIIAVIVLVLMSCSKEDDNSSSIKINQSDLVTYRNNTIQLSVTYSPSDLKNSGCVWASNDNNVATVSTSGLVTGVRIGTTYITATLTRSNVLSKIKVTINPMYSMYIEPYTGFGANISTVKSFERRTLLNESATQLVYSGENSNVRGTAYTFSNGKLISCIALLANTTDATTLLTNFLNERYKLIGISSPYYMYEINSSVMGSLTVDSNLGLCVLYLPNTSTKSSNIIPNHLNSYNTVISGQ